MVSLKDIIGCYSSTSGTESIVNRIIVADNGKVEMDGPRDAVLQQLAKMKQKTNNCSPKPK